MEYWGDEVCACPFEVLNSACWRRQVIKNESSRDQIRFDGLASHGTAKRKVKAIIGSSILDDYCTQNNIVLTFCITISNVLSEKNQLFFIVNLGFIRLRTTSCVFALFKTVFIKFREYNLFKLKLHRTV